MSATTLQVITRQILAFPVDGGLVIAERFAAANIEVDEVKECNLYTYRVSLIPFIATYS